MRSKTEYVQAKGPDGSTVIKKVGAAPVQRDGMEYEFTVFLDLSSEHVAAASKDRTGLLDGQYFTPSVETGRLLKEWLESGPGPEVAGQKPVVEPAVHVAAPELAPVATGAGRGEGQVSQQAQEPMPEAATGGQCRRYGGGTCTDCGKAVTGSGAAYSRRTFGRVLCPACQRAAAREAAR